MKSRRALYIAIAVTAVILLAIGSLAWFGNKFKAEAEETVTELYGALLNGDTERVEALTVFSSRRDLAELESEYGAVKSFEILDVGSTFDGIWEVRVAVSREGWETEETVANVGRRETAAMITLSWGKEPKRAPELGTEGHGQ